VARSFRASDRTLCLNSERAIVSWIRTMAGDELTSRRPTLEELLAKDEGVGAFEGRPKYAPAPPKVRAVVAAGEKAGAFKAQPVMRMAAKVQPAIARVQPVLRMAAKVGLLGAISQARACVMAAARRARPRARRERRHVARSGSARGDPDLADGESDLEPSHGLGARS
jgi:hypothetical protein